LTFADVQQVLQGSAGSFRIVTWLKFKTFLAPPSVTTFTYSWTFDVNVTTNALVGFQKFVESAIPPELGVEINIFKGTSTGMINYELVEGYYGAASKLNASIAPYLSTLPTPGTTWDCT
jgi:hypothetical protein